MNKTTTWIIVAVLAIVVVLAVVFGGGKKKAAVPGEKQQATQEQVSGQITAAGSTALQPLVEQAAKEFMNENPNVTITVQGGGSGTGLTQVAEGNVDIGNSDIFAEEKEGVDASQLVDHKVCVIGMAAVVNNAVGEKVKNLTKQQLIDIFTGKITNWKDVGGPDQKVVLVNRPASSGTRATFKKFALNGAEEAKGIEEDSSGTVHKIISETPGAIGYLALSYLDDKVTALSLDGVEPTVDKIVSGAYPVWAYEHMYTKGEPKGAVKAFLDYMLSEKVQNEFVTQLGYIPVTKMQVERDAEGNITQK